MFTSVQTSGLLGGSNHKYGDKTDNSPHDIVISVNCDLSTFVISVNCDLSKL